MSVFRSILFPVDFSERCRAAAPFVKKMAERCGAGLTLMSVVELPVSIYSTMGYESILDVPGMRRSAQEQLDAFLGAEFAGVRAKAVVEEGRAEAQIARYASEQDIDLIMMPTHGYGPFRSALLGSVTAKVLHDAACPVWTDAHVEGPSSGGQVECKSMLCAVDVGPKNVPLIRHAARLACEFGAKLRLVHAIAGAEGLPEKHFDVEFRRFQFEKARADIRDLQVEAGTDFDMCIEGGSVARVVRGASQHHEADLVVIGRGVIHEPLGRLRTNTYAVIRESICPVLSW